MWTVILSHGMWHDPVFAASFAWLTCWLLADSPDQAMKFNVPIAAGDVMIMGTDGLYDNVYEKYRPPPPTVNASRQ